jgi:hypothetical protein
VAGLFEMICQGGCGTEITDEELKRSIPSFPLELLACLRWRECEAGNPASVSVFEDRPPGVGSVCQRLGPENHNAEGGFGFGLAVHLPPNGASPPEGHAFAGDKNEPLLENVPWL